MEAVRLPFPRDDVQNSRAFASDKMQKHPVAKIWDEKVTRDEFPLSIRYQREVMWQWKEKNGRKVYWIGLGVLHNGRVDTWRSYVCFPGF